MAASLCTYSSYSYNHLSRNSIPANNCNPKFTPLTKRSSRQKYSLHFQAKDNNKQQQRHLNVRATSSSPCQLPAINGDLTLSAPWGTPSISGNLGIRATSQENPPIMPAIMTPGGFIDLGSVLLRNRVIFIGQPINPQVSERVISQLMTLATVNPYDDIMVFINSPGGSIYSVMAIYDCMSWIKPKVGTVCFGVAASHSALILAGGEKGMRYGMPNCRIMIHQPQGGFEGDIIKVRPQVEELASNHDKIDKMYAAFTGQPLEIVKYHTDRDRFFSAAEAMDFGLIDGLVETEY